MLAQRIPEKAVPHPQYQDAFNRTFAALRVSLTQACNFSCVYCVPENSKLTRLKNELTPYEFSVIVSALVKVAGINKIRFTGGEPLIYRGFDQVLESIAKVGVKTLSLTTNAVYLSKKLDLLWENGVRGLNISLDSLDADRFRLLSRGGDLNRVLLSLEQACAMGFRLRLNVVPMQVNFEETVPILRYCLERGIECRYIELMKMGHVADMFDQSFISMNMLLNAIGAEYSVEPAEAPPDSTALRFHIPGKGYFGIIANESQPFCAGCNRLRLTSNGLLYGCLSNERHHSVRHLIDCTPQEREAELMRILPEAMQSKQSTFQGSANFMKFMGG